MDNNGTYLIGCFDNLQVYIFKALITNIFHQFPSVLSLDKDAECLGKLYNLHCVSVFLQEYHMVGDQRID